jgi:hypothetical protein
MRLNLKGRRQENIFGWPCWSWANREDSSASACNEHVRELNGVTALQRSRHEAHTSFYICLGCRSTHNIALLPLVTTRHRGPLKNFRCKRQIENEKFVFASNPDAHLINSPGRNIYDVLSIFHYSCRAKDAERAIRSHNKRIPRVTIIWHFIASRDGCPSVNERSISDNHCLSFAVLCDNQINSASKCDIGHIKQSAFIPNIEREYER